MNEIFKGMLFAIGFVPTCFMIVIFFMHIEAILRKIPPPSLKYKDDGRD